MSFKVMGPLNKVLAPLLGQGIRMPRSVTTRLLATVRDQDGSDKKIQRAIKDIRRDFSSLPDPVERGSMTASALKTRAIIKDRSPFNVELFGAVITLLGKDITDPITYGCFLHGATSDTVYRQMKDPDLRKEIIEQATSHIVDPGIREKIIGLATDLRDRTK